MRLTKGFLWKTSIPVGVLLLALAFLQLWMSSAATQNRIRDELSRKLGMEIKFEKIQTGIRRGLRIKELTGSKPNGSSLQSKEIRVRPGLLHLLLGRIVVSEIRVDSPRLVWVEDASEPETGQAAAITAPRSNPLDVLINDSPDRRKISLRRIVVQNADLQWISRSGQSLLQIEGLSLEVQSDEQGRGSGRLQAARGALWETLSFHAVQAALALDGSALSIPDLAAKSGGGHIAVSAKATFAEPGIPFEVKASLQNVDLARTNAETPSLRLGGIADGNLDLHGTSLKSAAVSGSGSLHLKDGFFKGLSLLQLLGQIFQINELANLKIRQGDAQFTISDRKIHLEPLILRSDDLAFQASGPLDFDKRLALQARLGLPERLLKSKNFQGFLDRFSPPDAEGRRSIDFQITGSLDKPRTNLVEKIVSEGAGNLLQQVIGNFLKPKSPPQKDSPEQVPGRDSNSSEAAPKNR